MTAVSAVEPTVIATGFHALSDPTRLEIISMLRHGERCVCDLTDALDVAQSRLSFHLRVLKNAGLVSDRRDGRWVYYTLNANAFAILESYLNEFARTQFSHIGSSNPKRCCD